MLETLLPFVGCLCLITFFTLHFPNIFSKQMPPELICAMMQKIRGPNGCQPARTKQAGILKIKEVMLWGLM